MLSDFEAVRTLPGGPPALSTTTSAGGCQVPMPGFSQPMGQGVGNISNIVSWPASSIWPEARTMMGWGGNLPQPGLFNGSFSNLVTPPLLSPTTQSSFGRSVGVPLYQPQTHHSISQSARGSTRKS